ncbi:MAG: TolC family protein [Candidatus Eremiobacteraeota bacterium]|nr:TolC family protein [Candidatus Eremiobacteraeota bacterium]
MTMTLPDAVAFALDHTSTVATQRAAVSSAEHAVALQRETAYPTVSAMLQSFLAKSANYQGQFAAIGQTQQSVVSQNTAQVGFTNWNLTTGGFAFLALAASRAQAEQAKNTLANTEDQIATNVTNSFYGIVGRQALVAVDQVTLDAQNALVNSAQARERAGVAAGVDVLQAKTSAAKSQSALVGDRAAVDDASEALAQQIGAPLDTHFALPVQVPQPPLPKGSVNTLVSIANANRPDVAAAHEAIVAATFTRRSWNVELYPTVSLSASLGNQYSPTNSVAEQTQLNEECQLYRIAPFCPPPTVPRGVPGFWALEAVSTFSLPLVDYNARHSERVNDDAQLVAAQSSYAQTRLQAELDVRQSVRGAQTAQSQLSWAKEEAAYGTESARIAQLQYKAGVKTIYDVLQAQTAAQQALEDYVTARITYVEAVVKLRVSLGTFDARSAVADLQ